MSTLGPHFKALGKLSARLASLCISGVAGYETQVGEWALSHTGQE